MSCGYSEELLALYVEGDLPAAREQRVRRHLDACASCRDTAAELRSSVEAYRGFRGRGVSAPELSDLRQRIRRQITDSGNSTGLALQLERAVYAGWRRRWVLAGAGMSAVVLALALTPLWKARPEATAVPVADVAPAVAVTPPAPAAFSGESLKQHPAPPRPRVARHAPAAAGEDPPASPVVEAPAQEIFVKLYTSNPDVVIYWFIEPKGAGE